MSADLFIDRVASGSTVCGKLGPDGPPVARRTWLQTRLAERGGPR